MPTYIVVGPSAAPMIPTAAESFRASSPTMPNCGSINKVRMNVAKIPNCAAAPKKIINGFLKRGVKSIIAPMAMNIRMGKSSVEIPASRRISRKPTSAVSMPKRFVTLPTTLKGRLTRIAPKPIGKRRAGSYSFLIAR